MKSIKLTPLARAALALSLAACGSSSAPAISGSAYLGPIANATVAFYALNDDGSVAQTPLATATTGTDGSFALWRSLRYPLFVRVTGGSYQEEATGASAELSEEVDAVYLAAPSLMVVSPYSNAIVADARAAGGLTASNVSTAISRVDAFAGNIDVQQTLPTFVAAGSTANVTPGATMALALGAESQSRTSTGLSIAGSTANIVAQAANGDSLTQCNSGAGDIATDGTLAAPAAANCAITVGATDYLGGTHNRSGITSISQLAPVILGNPTAITVSSGACQNRTTLLSEQFALFASRKNDVQALLGNGVTASNWSSYANGGTWGPRAAVYGAISTTSCADTATFQRELVMAAENYWVDQGINYCHHHIPGWLPPTSPAKFRNSSSGSTSGGDSSGMTCTANRKRDGSQSLTALPQDDINWQGVDCSDFTSWVYDFTGITHDQGNLETGIGTQACSTGDDPLVGKAQAGVLLDINQGNIASLVDHLRPGDLLYITQTAPVAAGSAPSNVADGYVVSHVITWTGKHFSDLRNGPDGSLYDPVTAGQRGSRLGADIASYLKSVDPTQTILPSDLGSSADKDPWMIIDSHFAGPAYRPFVIPTATLKADWYVKDLSHVRRVIDADSARTDPVLAPLIISQVGTTNGDYGKVITFSSPQSRASSGGYKMIYQRPKQNSIPTCYRVGTAATVQ